jgi:hypothetical protein
MYPNLTALLEMGRETTRVELRKDPKWPENAAELEALAAALTPEEKKAVAWFEGAPTTPLEQFLAYAYDEGFRDYYFLLPEGQSRPRR